MENIIDLTKKLAEKDARIAELEALVKYYEELFRLSKSRQFEPQSEKKGYFQYTVFGDEENEPDEDEPEPEKVVYIRRKKKTGKRKDDLSRLPVEVVEHEIPQEERVCPECGGEMHVMGHDTRREIKIIPAQAKVIEHKRAVYSCRDCEKNNDNVPIVKADMPAPLINNSVASASAVAYAMYQKYIMHAPLYRQEKSWEWQGVVLSRQTLANWIICCAFTILMPLYTRLKELLLANEVLHADESTLQVLREPGKSAVSKSYMWLYRTSCFIKQHIIFYEYQPSRSHKHPKEFLGGFTGFLHADGLPAYHKLIHMTIVGCWVHCRRKFIDALKTIPKAERDGSVAQEAIQRIGQLFHMEDQWADLSAEERYRLRLEKSKPKAEKFFIWLESQNVLPKTATGRAIHYALSQRKWLMNVYLDGRTELSNNRIENSVRPYAQGRRNWLFCNTVDGAKASAIIFTIMETAKANGLKPFEYMEFLLGVSPAEIAKATDLLLPWGEKVPEECRVLSIGSAKDA